MGKVKKSVADLEREIRSLRAKLAAARRGVGDKKTGKAVKAGKTKAKNPGRGKTPKPLSDERVARAVDNAPKRLAPGAFYNGHELSCNVGVYAVKAVAERDASEILGSPSVFVNRPIVFPDPRRYGIVPTVVSAKVVPHRGDIANKWAVRVSVEMTGSDDVHRKAWASGVLMRCRFYQEPSDAR